MQVKDITRHLPVNLKLRIKSILAGIKKSYINSFKTYDSDDLKEKLRKMGIQPNDSLLVHSNFNPDNGFMGSPNDMIDALLELVGDQGNLLMVSIPFRGRAKDYLLKGKTFRLTRTISMMGLITETFRRKTGVVRSLHPTHPVLVYGKDKRWLTEGHERCLYPCGVDTPFDKLGKLKGKILFLDVGINAMTFFHYMEDITKDKLPFNVYDDSTFKVTVVDGDNQEHTVETYVFNPEVITDVFKVEAELSKKGMIKRNKIGNTSLIIINTDDVIKCHTSLVEAGDYPYKRWA